MNAIVAALLSAVCASLSNLFFRKNADIHKGPSAKGELAQFLFFYYLSAFALSLISCPQLWSAKFNIPLFATGAFVGILNCLLMALSFRALRAGPAGLTFAFLNGSSLFPGLILFLLLGPDFGFSCSIIQGVGMVLVLIGLTIDARMKSSGQDKPAPQWLPYTLAAFFMQILAMSCFQGRSLLFNGGPGGFFDRMLATPADDIWFMPGLLGVPLIFQFALFLRKRTHLHKKESAYGSLAGTGYFASTWLLLLATQVATASQSCAIFPCFAISTMVLCNGWSYWLYEESFFLKTNLLCALGITITALG